VRIARLAAGRHGMYLDEYGLWRWHTSEEAALERESQPQSEFEVEVEFEFDPDDVPPPNWPGAPVGYWELVEGESEDRILDELELGSITPQRRNFRFLTSRKCASARGGTLLAEALEVGVGAEEDES
jgi:DNA polymerase beta